MSIRHVRVEKFSDVIREIEELAFGDEGENHIFRGQNDSNWPIVSTFSRYSTVKRDNMHHLAFEVLLRRFEHGLTQIGNREMVGQTRRGRLEFARHHGVPTPLIDFSYSPFISLWFAFNSIRGSVEPEKTVALYALNYNSMGVVYQNFCEKFHLVEFITRKYKIPPIDVFRWNVENYFEKGYPRHQIKFLSHAASWNTKAQKQMGCFLYDSIDYESIGVKNLEDFIENHEICKISGMPILLTKIAIPYKFSRDAFKYLDAIGINGSRLLGDEAGVSADVYNTFNYNPRMSAWDIPFNKPNERD